MVALLISKYVLLLVIMTAAAWILVAYVGAPQVVFSAVPAVFFVLVVLDVWRRRMARKEGV